MKRRNVIIIPAAGLATRMRPLSNTMSKAMVPVAGKPILGHILSTLEKTGVVDRVIIVDGETSDIRRFIKTVSYDMKIECVRQHCGSTANHSTAGPLEAVESGMSLLESDGSPTRVIVWLGDTLITDVDEARDFIMKETPTLGVSKVTDYSRWCMVESNTSGIKLHDKPTIKPHTNDALIGLYNLGSLLSAKTAIEVGMLTQTNNAIRFGLDRAESYELSYMINRLDDLKIMNIASWLDAGDLPSLYKANAKLINGNARAHNNIRIDGQVLIKSIVNDDDSEIGWYNAVISQFPDLQPITPQYYGAQLISNTFKIEVCSGSTLQEMLVYDDIRVDVWEYIIKATLGRYLDSIESYRHNQHNASGEYYMFAGNTQTRLLKIDPNMLTEEDHVRVCRHIHDTYAQAMRVSDEINCNYDIIHGDFHFGNIIFDASCDKLKLIDPRGRWGNKPSVNGNILYDLAKFYQSVYGEYAWIVTGQNVNQDLRNGILTHIDKLISERFSESVVTVAKKLSIVLLVSAIPFHNDNPGRQQAMLNTALRFIK